MYVLALSDYKQLAAAAGYKPAPQLAPPIRQINCSLYMLYLEYPPRILHRDAMKGAVLANKGTTVNAYDVAIGEGLA